MKEILIMIEKGVFYLLLSTLILYALSNKRNISLLVTLIVVFLSEFFLLLFESILNAQKTWIEPQLYKIAMYALFSSIELLAAFGLIQLHKIYNEALSSAAMFSIYGYLTLGSLQIVFCLLSFIVSGELITDIRQIIVALLFSTMLTGLFVSVIKDVLSKHLLIKWINK